jgi:phage terminase large subunit
VLAFEHPKDGIFVNFDLGISDATAMWAWRVNGEGGVDVLAHYEASGKPISHFFDKLEEWGVEEGFQYVKLFLPHDARARTLVTGASVQDAFHEKYGSGKVAMVPQLSLEDGLQAGRWLLEQPCRFHPRAAAGVEALRAYRYEFDEDTKAFSRKPVHDWSSHTADAWRYVACVVKVAIQLQTKPKPKPQPKARSLGDFTLTEMYAMAKRSPSRRRH